MGDSMKKKVIGILISITLLLTILPVSGIIEYDSNYWNNAKDNNNILSTNKLRDTQKIYGQLGRNNSPPYQPSNPNPTNGSIDVDLDIDINWTGGDPDGDNVTYCVYFGTSSTPPMVSDNQSGTTYDPGTLDEITTYYWQIIAWDNQSAFNESPIWDFTTLELPNQPPYQPSSPDPGDGATDVSLEADLSWTGGDPDADPVTYDVYFGTSSTPPKVSSNQSATTYDPGTLDEITTYYWQIIAWDDQGASNASPIWDFTTLELPNQPPYQPSSPDPGDGATDVSLEADLSWTGGDPDGDNVTYCVYFGTNNTPPMVSNNQTETIYSPGTLDKNTTYYWQIIAWDEWNLSTEGNIWSFTTKVNQPPYQPYNESPSNGSTGVGVNIELEWEGGDPESDLVTYDIYFGENSPPPKIESNYSGTTYDLDTLENEKTYYWQIVAWDEFGAHNSSSIWQFSTAMNSHPYPPEIITGPNVGGPEIELEFSAITSDPEGDQVYYMWDWGDGNFSEWLGPFGISTPVKPSYTWNDSGEYTIRIKAKDIHDKEGEWSEDYNISIATQIQINNLRPGFIYFHIFTFTGSYLFLQAFKYLGISAVISTGKLLVVNATVSEHVDSVKFDAFQILWNLTTEEPDDDMSDGAAVILSIAAGLYSITATAYDDDGNLIDVHTVPYLLYICRSQTGGGGQVARTLANRLRR